MVQQVFAKQKNDSVTVNGFIILMSRPESIYQGVHYFWMLVAARASFPISYVSAK